MKKSRRDVLTMGAAMVAAHLSPAVAQGTASVTSGAASSTPKKAVKPLSILILGGTGFTGPHQVRHALERGHKVTLFNRGRRPKEWPASVEELTGDRETNDYASLKGRKFDVCIDNPTSVPHWVRDAAAVLKGNVGHYIFISTISVYAGNDKPGADETAAREKYSGTDVMTETNATLRKNMRLYGPLKAACEDEAYRQFGRESTTIIRPALIVGPGDETDRFTYWPARFAKGGDVLVPPSSDPVQFIDARDIAEWTVRMAESRTAGDFNATGPAAMLTMGAMLDGIEAGVRVANGAAIKVPLKRREVSAEFLEKNKVSMWMDMPVWVHGSGETIGMHRRSNKKVLAAGITYRPVDVTAADTLKWWESQTAERRAAPRAGIKSEREAELLKLLG
jgi:2'-hydroxyisoflavone reductase